jgi:histidine triad (HIT) family protein
LPSSIVYRDERCTAFLDIQPVNEGHVLIIPNVHATYLGEMDGESAAHLMHVAHRVAAALRRSGVRCEGVNLFLADGEAAMQHVFHVHLHVIPRYAGDGFGLRFSERYGWRPERTMLDGVAERIHVAMR